MDPPIYEICLNKDETLEHIIIGCVFTVAFWETLDIVLPSDQLSDDELLQLELE